MREYRVAESMQDRWVIGVLTASGGSSDDQLSRQLLKHVACQKDLQTKWRV